MRISDWSSDVCSSDLLPEPHDELSPPATRESKGLLDLQFHGACYRLVINQGLLSHKPRSLSRVIFRVSKINLAACRRLDLNTDKAIYNGSATGRERGFPYGEHTVVEGKLKKKSIQNYEYE